MPELPRQSTADPTHLPTRHEREHAARDLARDIARAIERGDTRLAWDVEGTWTVSYDEAKVELVGVDGLGARITVHVSGTQDG